MTIQQIIGFNEICRLGSIVKASESLHITSAGLRLSLHRLEAECGVSLIVWGSHEVKLTDDGRYFLEQARKMTRISEEFKEYFGASGQRKEIVRIASGISFPSNFIGDTLMEFRATYSKYCFSLTDYANKYCDSAVEECKADIGFNTGPFDDKKFRYHPIMSYSLYLVVNRMNPLSQLHTFPTEYLSRYPLIIADMKVEDTLFLDNCRAAGTMPEIEARCARDTIVFRRVSSNPGLIGVTYKEIVGDVNFPNLVVIPFEDPRFKKTVYLFHKKGNHQSKAEVELVHFFLKKTENGIFDAEMQACNEMEDLSTIGDIISPRHQRRPLEPR